MATMRNKVNLIGRLGVTPELHNTANGNAYTRFTLAVNQRQKDKQGNWTDDTQWMSLVAWGKEAERFVKQVQKGMEVAVEGKIQNRQYEGKDGNKRYVTDIQVDSFFLLNVKQNTNAQN
ncbi:MAG TPA: single-stranded DNA-binding protein [Crocinitomicaceae bacterium]|nr:single-stranded DNA-binding protein [Crocinitomicaceae bacterium]